MAVAEKLSAVDAYLDALQHARKSEVAALRLVVLSAVPDLVERIKRGELAHSPKPLDP